MSFTAPADLEGTWQVSVVADPSYTQVGVPLPAVSTSLSVEGPQTLTYGQVGELVATLESDNPATGTVEVRNGGTVVGSGQLANQQAIIELDSTKIPMGANTLTVSYGGDAQNEESETTTTLEVVKAAPELSIELSKAKPVVKADSVVVTVSLGADGYQPTGQVALYVDGSIATLADLEDGKAKMRIKPFGSAGKHTVQVLYMGDAHTKAALAAKKVTAVKAKPKMTVKVKPKKVKVKKTRAKVVVTLTAVGQKPAGKVSVKVAGKTYKKVAKGGKVTIKLKPFRKKGKQKAVVKYAGNKLNKPVTKKITIKVTK